MCLHLGASKEHDSTSKKAQGLEGHSCTETSTHNSPFSCPRSTSAETSGFTSMWESSWEMERQSMDDGDEVVGLLNPVDKHQVIHVMRSGAPTPFSPVHPAPKAKAPPALQGPAWVAERSRARTPGPLQRGPRELTRTKSCGQGRPSTLTGASCLLAQL